MLIITILTSLTVEFAYEVYVNTSALSNWTNAQKASLIAKSGQVMSSNFLKKLGEAPYTYQNDINLLVEEDFGPDTELTIKIEDENSKFNINSIITENGGTNWNALASLQKLFEYLNINPSLEVVIADYIDPGQEPRPGLRDSEDNAKNSYLWSIDELKLIKGIDRKTFETISPYLTVYGDGKININTAKLPVLFSMGKDMTETLAKKIIVYRESTPFNIPGQERNIEGMSGIVYWVQPTIKSSTLKIISTATVKEIARIIESVTDTSMKVLYWREG